MKKPLKIVLISIGLIFLLYHILSWTRILTIYSDLKTSNLPTLELDTKLITTNLIKPKNGDFILYSNEKNVLRKTAVNRLCGKENDIVEIKYGTLFINGENFDKELNLIYFYTLSKTEYKRVKSELKKEIRFHSKTGNKKDSIMISSSSSKANLMASFKCSILCTFEIPKLLPALFAFTKHGNPTFSMISFS